MRMQLPKTNLRSFAAATLLAIAAANGCGAEPGTAPGAGGRAGTAGKGGTLPSGGEAGTGVAGTGSGGSFAPGVGGAGGDNGTGGGSSISPGMSGTGGTGGGMIGAASGGVDGTGSGGLGGGVASMALANIVPVNPGTTSGTATFVMTDKGVSLTMNLMNCPQGRHPLFILAGNTCTNATTQGAHWGPTRGENIGPNGGEISCDASQRGTLGTLPYTRLNPDPVTRWTIGDGGMSDLIGHPIVVLTLDGRGREGCGVIQLSPGGAGGAAGGAGTGGGGRSGSAGTSGSAGSHGSGGSMGSGGSTGSGGSQGSAGSQGNGGSSAASGGSSGSGGGGAAGNHGAGGSAGASGSAGAAGSAGAGGAGPRTAAAMMMPFETGTISGTVTFVEITNGVKVTYDVTNCPTGQHPTQIHAGTGCGSAAAQGEPWVRGTNIGPSGGEISCDDTLHGTLTYVRTNDDPSVSWTIGGGSASDLLGHPIVIRALNAVDRDACGVIARTGAGGAGGPP